MNLLLDTHILIWTLLNDEKLPEKARELIANPKNTIYYSAVSLWETTIKHSLHPHEMAYSGRELYRACGRANFILLGIEPNHIFTVDSLKYPDDAPSHKDPFDRLLIAQAKNEKMKFITHDSKIPFYGEFCIYSV